METLNSPVGIGAWALRNRIVMAPLTRCRAGAGRVPGAAMVEYYRQRAGAGLIVSEATAISPQAVGYPDTPGIWTEAQVEGWKAVTRAVHEAGGVFILQLWHVGRVSDPLYLDGATPVGPSAIAAEGHVRLLRPKRAFGIPRALETEEIAGILADYRRAAENAKRAGFDGVEIHGANGYLPDQFLHAGSNRRTDLYGGPVENRARFMLEALDAAISVWGPDRVGLHISPADNSHSMHDDERTAIYSHVAREAGRRHIAFLFAREPADHPARLGPELKRIFGGAYVVNDGFTHESGSRAIAEGLADAVAYGRLFIANPDLPARFARNAPLNVPDPDTFYTGGPSRGYTDYPPLP